MSTETIPEQPSSAGLAPLPRAPGLRPADSAALRLLSCAAFAVLVVCLLLLPADHSETGETLSWILAFAVALPCGLVLAEYQARSLASAAPAAAARALAAGIGLLAVAMLLRRVGVGDGLHHGLLAVAALGALAAPFLAARRWRDRGDDRDEIARVVGVSSLAFVALLFVPRAALRPGNLISALVLAAAALLVLRFVGRRRLPRWPRRALGAVLCGLLALVVIQLPEISLYTGNVLLHHGFFLGPANDVLHGRAMLGSAWSQYGVGLIDALGLTFTVVPIGFGTLALVVVALTVAQYLCVYAILRLAGVGQLLTVIVVAVAAVGNLFSQLETYLAFPSVSPLRFGLAYLLILGAVLAARFPARAGPLRLAVLAVLGIAAIWSFETFAYCAVTYGCLVLVEALCDGTEVARRLLRGAAAGLGASALGVALFSLLTLAFGGGLDWGPYFEYIRLYSVDEFSQVPIAFFSAGPLMGAAIFIGAVTLLWLVRAYPRALAPPMRAGLTGFTGLAIVTFTYYLGRSHPNNLLVLLVPVVVLAGLWGQVLLMARPVPWRSAAAATIALALAMIAVAGWPSVERKASVTGLALAMPGGASLHHSLADLANNPVLDARAPVGAALLAERLPPGAPALVLGEDDLTTEILMRAGRRNLLPISHLPEDVLIESSFGRVRREVSEGVPAGTLMLTSPPILFGGPPRFNKLQQAALSALYRRFAFRLIQRTPEGLELVRLVKR